MMFSNLTYSQQSIIDAVANEILDAMKALELFKDELSNKIKKQIVVLSLVLIITLKTQQNKA